MSLHAKSALELRRMLDSREVSAREVTEDHLGHIDRIDPKVRAFLTITHDEALSQAEKAQRKIDAGEQQPLTGIPIALKDNMCTGGIRTTCASKILEDYIPPYNGTLYSKMRSAGAVLLGKTNLDEFAMGASTEFSGFYPTYNPWDLSRSPGGSSGGSAAAVCAQMAAISFGSDTGGSVRQPASLCGVVGFKPTYGRISRYGLVAFSSSLDQIGPFARTVTDARWAFEAAFGPDGLDSTCISKNYDAAAAAKPILKGRRAGIPRELLSEAVSSDVKQAVDEAITKLTDAGLIVEEFSAPMIEHGVSTYYIIAPAEASSNLARYDGVRYGLRIAADTHIDLMKNTRAQGFGKEVKERIIIGTYVLSAGYYDAFYAKAHQVRTLMKQQFIEAFAKYDVIIGPTSPNTAFKIGELAGDPLALKLADYCTIPANIGGFPAISINCGFANGLPVGLQFFGNSFDEETLFSTALAAEEVLNVAGASPPIAHG